MFDKGKKYKIQDLEGIYYTALIVEETSTHIVFIDLNNQKGGLEKAQIKKWKEIQNRIEGEDNEQ